MAPISRELVREAWPRIVASLHELGLYASSTPPSRVEPLNAHANVVRLASAETSVDLVLKIMSGIEREVHAFVNSRVPGVSPVLYGWYEAPSLQGRELVVMEDVRTGEPLTQQSQMSASTRRQVYTAAVRAIAGVHTGCTDAPRQLRLPCVQMTVSDEMADALPDCIDMLTLLGMNVDVGSSDIAAVGRCVMSLTSDLKQRSSGSETLVHGDLHPSNVVPRPTQDICLFDWGSAARGMAEWDLVMCDHDQVAAYMQAAAEVGWEVDGQTFSQRLRAATVARIAKALVTGLGIVLDQPDARTARDLLRAMPIQIGIMLQAADTPRYLGFDPYTVGRTLAGDSQ